MIIDTDIVKIPSGLIIHKAVSRARIHHAACERGKRSFGEPALAKVWRQVTCDACAQAMGYRDLIELHEKRRTLG